jgi:hypothetical protein
MLHLPQMLKNHGSFPLESPYSGERSTQRMKAMKSKLMALCLVCLGAVAIGSVAASTAHATAKFTAKEYPAVFTATQEDEENAGDNYFEMTPGRKVTCAHSKYEATLGAAATKITVTPHFGKKEGASEECKDAATGIAVQIHLNGCHFEFEAITYTAADETTHGKANIICPAGKKITITAATCTVHIQGSADGKNKGLTGVTFTNKAAVATKTPEPFVTVDVEIKNQIHYEDTDGFLCPFEGSNTNTNGTFVTTVAVKSFKANGTQVHTTTRGVTTYKHTGEEIFNHVK